jgi:hypothetical protein
MLRLTLFITSPHKENNSEDNHIIRIMKHMKKNQSGTKDVLQNFTNGWHPGGMVRRVVTRTELSEVL